MGWRRLRARELAHHRERRAVLEVERLEQRTLLRREVRVASLDVVVRDEHLLPPTVAEVALERELPRRPAVPTHLGHDRSERSYDGLGQERRTLNLVDRRPVEGGEH